MRRLYLSPAAEADIDEAADFYSERGGMELGVKFYAAVESTWRQLLEAPGFGKVQEWVPARLSGCRRWQVASPFLAYQVFYLSTAVRVDVLRVVHGAQDRSELFGDTIR